MKAVSFDQAAGFYDRTRGFPPGVADEVAEAAAEMLGPAKRLLEVGIGTGRISRPLLARGYDITGVDLSRRMMEQLLGALPPGAPPPALAQGDAVHLPFAAQSFDAAVTVHVFHLIAGWREALAEVRRCVRPGGVLLSGYDHRPRGFPGDLLKRKWRDIVRRRGYDHLQPGTLEFEDVRRALTDAGVQTEERSVGNWETTRTVAQHIETVEHRTWSHTWAVPDGLFAACLDELRAWAVEQWGSLDHEFTTPHTIVWHRFQL
jgi:SAM-dependent methyltransferase